MKQLHEYETPETNNVSSKYHKMIYGIDGVFLHAKRLERRLALCRDALAEISWKANCQLAADIAEKAITAQKQ